MTSGGTHQNHLGNYLARLVEKRHNDDVTTLAAAACLDSIGIIGRSSNKRERGAESHAHTRRMEVAVHYRVGDDDVRLTICFYMGSGWCGSLDEPRQIAILSSCFLM